MTISPTRAPEATLREGGLWGALEAGILDLEVALSRGGQLVGLVCTLLASGVTVLVDATLGIPMLGVSVACLTWFTVAHQALSRGIYVTAFRWASPLFETLVPGIVMLLLVRVQGPDYALGSWVPPQLFAVFIGLSVLRLRRRLPVLVGALAALEYGLVYVLFIAPHVDPAVNLLFRPDVQVVRCATLLLAGATGSLAVVGIKRAVARAGHDARAQDLFGKYRLGRLIASGGMGRVVEATYAPEGGFERRVAVKLIHPHLASDPRFIEQFRHEASLCAKLSHPNIAAALDFGRVGQTWFFAMEFVDGPTVSEIQDHMAKVDQHLKPAIVASIGREITAALHFAHEVARDVDGALLRVVHRDLSPANILLERSGTVKVLDFGVARALREVQRGHTPNMAGKPSYLAPETLKHEVFDARSDLFALGIILWELLANRRLFRRNNDGASMLAVVEAEIPAITSVRPDLHRDWDAFFARALARDPAARFQSAVDVDLALAALQQRVGVAQAPDLAAIARTVTDVEELDVELE